MRTVSWMSSLPAFEPLSSSKTRELLCYLRPADRGLDLRYCCRWSSCDAPWRPWCQSSCIKCAISVHCCNVQHMTHGQVSQRSSLKGAYCMISSSIARTFSWPSSGSGGVQSSSITLRSHSSFLSYKYACTSLYGGEMIRSHVHPQPRQK